MKKTPSRIDGIAVIVLSIGIPCAIFAYSIVQSGERNIDILETIQGIPYPTNNNATVILENMAHADIFLQESVFAKRAIFTVSFDPGNAKQIDIGVRENEFWLSYVKYPLYTREIDGDGFQTKEISIPLTDTMQDTNRSIDTMFFTESFAPLPEWRIHTFRASVETYMPSAQETVAYIKSVLTKERAL